MVTINVSMLFLFLYVSSLCLNSSFTEIISSQTFIIGSTKIKVLSMKIHVSLAGIQD